MTEGFAQVREVPYGELEAPDESSMRLPALEVCGGCDTGGCGVSEDRAPIASIETFDKEFRAGLGYHQPASVLSSVGVMASATGATNSKFVARRETPLWIPENCTQCMDCITSCPDTALPNTAQDLGEVLKAVANGYVSDAEQRGRLLAELPALENKLRTRMSEVVADKGSTSFKELITEQLDALQHIDADTRAQYAALFDCVPFAYQKVNAIFRSIEKKQPGAGGIFAIMVSDLCKGCGECVTECGDKNALVMTDETAEVNADHVSGTNFLELLQDTPQKYLGKYDPADAVGSHQAALHNHLMRRSDYEALVSGDGACAGCGEKSVLRAIVTLTEAHMRPIYHTKAARLRTKADRLVADGARMLDQLATRDAEEYRLFTRAVAHLILGLGGEDDADTDARLAAHGPISNQDLVDALVMVLRQDAHNHRDVQAADGRAPNGMAVMAMGAHTGCNTVFGSTPPNNPHPYPWMNSLFQDGATVTWLFGESFIMDHARRSVIPERLVDALFDREQDVMSAEDLFRLTHLTDSQMTAREISELPKAWCVGGDGGMGDIGFQNVSKVVLQNRPNVKMLLLDTQVYSNTGGQNSDSTPMPGGGDMNQFGLASEGKLTEKKGVAECFLGGHGSPFIAQVSMANSARLYRAILDGLDYRGTAFLQCFTTCQPEHGVADDLSTVQAGRIRDSRGMPEFVFDPRGGETYGDAFNLKGNPKLERDWTEIRSKVTKRTFRYTVAHWAATEARFRRHLKPAKDTSGLIPLDDILLRVTQDDVVQRHVLDANHLAFVPHWGVTIDVEDDHGKLRSLVLSRQMVLFCVERRRSWRMLQSRAGIVNPDYVAQRALLARLAAGEISEADLRERGMELFEDALAEAQGKPRQAASAK